MLLSIYSHTTQLHLHYGHWIFLDTPSLTSSQRVLLKGRPACKHALDAATVTGNVAWTLECRGSVTRGGSSTTQIKRIS